MIKRYGPVVSAEILRHWGFYKVWDKDLSQMYPLSGAKKFQSSSVVRICL